MPRINKFSELLGFVAWASIFGESWLLLLRAIPLDWLAIVLFIMFLMIAFSVFSQNYTPRPARLAEPGLCDCKVRNVTIDAKTRVPVCRACGKVRLDETDVK